MAKKFNYVYVTINILNGRGYVGSHGTNNENDSYIGSGGYFKKAIKKYGKENFIQIKLKEYDSILEARKAEEHYIKLFDTLSPKGYNMSITGGQGSWGGKLSEEYKKKISASMKGKHKGKIQWNKDLKMDKEFSDKTKKGIKNKRSKNPKYINRRTPGGSGKKGGTLTEEHKRKISESCMGRKHSEETKRKIGIGHKGLKYVK